MRTYHSRLFFRPFERVHDVLVETLIEIATHGGKQAVAAPRGIGKSEIIKKMIEWLMLAGLIRFPVPVCQTTLHANEIYNDIRESFEQNDLLYEDFPEVCHPIRSLNGAPQGARRQHVDNEPTRLVWKQTGFRLANIPEKYRAGIDYGGVRMEFRGLDAAIRGINRSGDRPDFVPVDDPETRESANSDSQIADRERAIDQDVSYLAGHGQRLGLAMITTIQNRKCISFKYVHEKSAWMGQRFGWVKDWPEEWGGPESDGKWHEYIRLRQADQFQGDRHGQNAIRYFLDNKGKLLRGGKLNSSYFEPDTLPDGTPLIHSAWQVIFNQIADTSFEAFSTEKQNDPPEEYSAEGTGITAPIVANRVSGLDQGQLPANAASITVGIDLGKYRCHWVAVAWWKGAGGCVIDYGVAEVTGTDTAIDNDASEPHIYRALLDWREMMLEKRYMDAAGAERKIDCVFVDSGTFTNAAYEFVRQVRAPFHACKGLANYRPRSQSTDKIRAGDNMHAAWQESQDLWLFDLNTDYWKNWVHERFLTPTFDEDNLLRRGGLSLYVPRGSQKHTSFAKHIVAEELVTEFREGKGSRTYWDVKHSNNHWLDALYYASAAGRYTGVDLLGQAEVKNLPRKVEVQAEAERKAKPKRTQHGRTNLQRRQGGWMQSIRRRR